MNGYFITGIVAGALGIAIGAGGTHFFDAGHYAAQLATEKAAHAKDNEQHANDMLAVSRAALDGEQRAVDAHDKAEAAIAAADAQTTKEKDAHETDNRNYRAALAAGTQRVRVAVRNCSSASAANVSGAAGAASVGDGASASADLDPAVAERVFRVAGDDDNEISKVKALQAYVCAIRPATPGCDAR
ncbi:lysis system i-spanin subunit Rz [Paraburkholderia sp. BCC1885]|uniref:lysis system i-spanin subunit Rz n=1 Tax=Paraburkholderia sp. BCC1885 TaxID=2562669 RepID=UPI0011838935|nr:lysis system i-spanin subunit Rz [Paraburkholderia sp. BCC1885]